ncbi:MAG: TadA family conjugal transfer-associated ATPase [Frankiaceae bacterium]
MAAAFDATVRPVVAFDATVRPVVAFDATSLDPALVDRVRNRLANEQAPATPSRVAAALRAEGGLRGETDLLPVLRALQSELLGAGPLEPLLALPGVTDVLVTGPDLVCIDRGRGMESVGVRFADEASVRRLAVRLVTAAGRRLDAAQPFADVVLADGTRLHAALPPVTRTPCLSLRVPARRPFTLDEMVAAGTLNPKVAAVLVRMVLARMTLLISGRAGTGKTTLSAALLGQVPATERIVVIEDDPELRIDHPHVVHLDARRPNVEGAGEIGLGELVRQSLRMRPDRLVLGEVRGAEVAALLAAFTSGHQGGLTTLHAAGPADVPARMEALALQAGVPRAALHSQLSVAVDAVIHLERAAGGDRRVDTVAVLVPDRRGFAQAQPALVWAQGVVVPGPAAALLARRLGQSGAGLPDAVGGVLAGPPDRDMGR